MSEAVRSFPQSIAVPAAQPVVPVFALGMIGLGILALAFGDFAMVWQPVAPWIPGRTAMAYGSGLLMLGCGVGLFTRAAAWAMRLLFAYLCVWLLLKVPALVVAPQIEGVWLGFGEIGILFAGGWTLFARLAALPPASPLRFLTGPRAIRAARIAFALSIVPIGVGHLMYRKETFALVPTWLPWRGFLGDATGVAQIVFGLAVLFSIVPRVAAYAEAVLIGMFALLVWVPPVVAAPTARLPWTAFLISWAIGAAAWAVAESTPARHVTAPEP